MTALRRRAMLALLAIALVAAAASITFAAYNATTTNPGNSLTAGSVAISDNDGGAAMLSLSAAGLGASDTSCIKATYTGTLGADVRHWATVSGNLAPYLSLKVTRGTGASVFDSCSDFTPDTANPYGKGAGVLYDGKLSNYPTGWSAGIVDPSDSGSGTAYASTVLGTAGLVSYWRLGDGAISADEFTDTTGKVLSSHTGAIAASWTASSGQARTALISDQNRLRKETGNGAAQYFTSATPPSADYVVEADVHAKSLLATDTAGVIGRLDTSSANGTYYMARYDVDTTDWDLLKVVNGTATLLGFYNDTALTTGQNYRLTLDMNGSTIRLLVNGVQRVSVTDTAITAAGRGGIRLGTSGSTAAVSNTAGLHLDNFRISSRTTTAVDSAGSNTGTYVNGPVLNTAGGLPGDTNRAVEFDGVDDDVQVADAASLDLGNGPMTIEAWARYDGTGDGTIVEKGNNAYKLYIKNNRLTLRKQGIADIVQSTNTINDGAFHHLAMTKNGATTKLYVDGVDVTGTVIDQTLADTANPLHIGATSQFDGVLDEVAIYNTALSAATVQAHFATMAASELWSTSEEHAYKFQITVDNDLGALAKSASATFQWEARNR